MPEVFKEAGYQTGMFGKWHLGDNYPYRPENRGFDVAMMHGGGAIGNIPDYWNNDYFDDTYFLNGQPQKKEGYCTDVWFNEAMDFIENNRNNPFFVYLATNAPHGPFVVDTLYSNPFKDNEAIVNPEFYGMIANIDHNLGRLRAKLQELGLSDNTIFIFMSDNGTARGCEIDENGFMTKGFNAGMRAKKAWPYEGGHRVPFFIYWPDGNLPGGRDVDNLAGAIDILPTLMDLCDISSQINPDLDGTSLQPLLKGDGNWNDRVLITDTQREDSLVKYKQYSIMSEDWRLVNGELYDAKNDHGQTRNLANDYPDVVRELMEAYDQWWEQTTHRKDDYTYVPLGELPDEQLFTHHDLHPDNAESPAWHQGQVRSGWTRKGYWAVEVTTGGKYQFELRRWPRESGYKITEGTPKGDLIPQGYAYQEGQRIPIKRAILEIGDVREELPVNPQAESVNFIATLQPGTYELRGYFRYDDGTENSAYYLYSSLAE